MKALRMEGDLPISKWEDFKTLITSQFYHIGYVEDRWIYCRYSKKRKGQSVQDYTTKVRKLAIMLGMMYSSSILGEYIVIYESN